MWIPALVDQYLCERFLDGPRSWEGWLLRNIGDLKLSANRTGPAIGCFESRQDFKQGGFAGAVGADEANVVSFEERDREIGKQGCTP